jgi:hypothetical protein
MHEKVRSLEQQETGEIRRLRCAPIADNSGLSLWSSCVVISWFADGMRPRKRNGRKIEWGLDRMRQPDEVALVASSPSSGRAQLNRILREYAPEGGGIGPAAKILTAGPTGASEEGETINQ